jgi:hypothetical protein
MGDIRQTHELIDEICGILRGRSGLLDMVTKMSYRHPNGFDKISLDYSHLQSVTRRIHLWWPPGSDPLNREHISCAESDIHNHPWAFTSKILCGSIRNETFRLVTSSQQSVPRDAFRIEIPTDGSKAKPSSKYIGTQHVEIFGAQDLHIGDSYALNEEILHRIVPLGERPVSTLVAQMPLGRSNSIVLRRAEECPRPKVKHRKFTQREARSLLEAFLDVITSID